MKGKRVYVMTARSAKAEATRQRICDSVMALYRERGMDGFTLDDGAARAETTVQTALRAFKSKDNLVLEALTRFTKSEAAQLSDRPSGFAPTPPGDVCAAIAEIVSVYETMGDLVVRNLNDEQRNPAIKPLIENGRKSHSAWVKSVFAPQLAARRGSARSQLFNCLLVATDVLTWQILRRDLKLSRSATEATIRYMVDAIANMESADDTLPLAELVGRRQPAA
jgi:AcrR family transcriptional regulator